MNNVTVLNTALTQRVRLVDEARRIIGEIDQCFLDVEHWNDAHALAERIDADPDGELRRVRASLKNMIELQLEKGVKA